MAINSPLVRCNPVDAVLLPEQQTRGGSLDLPAVGPASRCGLMLRGGGGGASVSPQSRAPGRRTGVDQEQRPQLPCSTERGRQCVSDTGYGLTFPVAIPLGICTNRCPQWMKPTSPTAPQLARLLSGVELRCQEAPKHNRLRATMGADHPHTSCRCERHAASEKTCICRVLPLLPWSCPHRAGGDLGGGRSQPGKNTERLVTKASITFYLQTNQRAGNLSSLQ